MEQLAISDFTQNKRWTSTVANPPAAHLSGKHCMVCDHLLTVHQAVRGITCDDPQCRNQQLRKGLAERQRTELAALRRAAMEHRNRTAARIGITDPESLALAIVPAYRQRVVKLPERRRLQFRAYLESIIDRASDWQPDAAESWALELELLAAVHESPVPRLSAATCATCQGYCCRTGGTRAHLDAATLCGFKLRNPDTSKSELPGLYLERLPSKSFADSCVFHTASGCALPREMRSSKCNEYSCDGLREFCSLTEEGASTKFLLVAGYAGEPVRSAVALPDGRRVPVPRRRTEAR